MEILPSQEQLIRFTPTNNYRPSDQYSDSFYNEVRTTPKGRKMKNEQYEQIKYPQNINQNIMKIQKTLSRERRPKEYEPRNIYEKPSYLNNKQNY